MLVPASQRVVSLICFQVPHVCCEPAACNVVFDQVKVGHMWINDDLDDMKCSGLDNWPPLTLGVLLDLLMLLRPC